MTKVNQTQDLTNKLLRDIRTYAEAAGMTIQQYLGDLVRKMPMPK